MITVVRWRKEGGLEQGGEELLEGPGLRWIELEEPNADVLAPLAKRFGLHPLAIEDCLHLDQRPKMEEYPGHQFVVLQGFACPDRQLDHLELHEMHFFLGPDWLITVHTGKSAATGLARRRMVDDPELTIGKGVDFILYLIADALMDESFPLLDTFNDELEVLEEAIFDTPKTGHLQQAFDLKRRLQRVRQVLSPQRDVVGMLSRGVHHVQPATTIYFRDVYDHLNRLYERIDTTRDLVGNTLEGYLSVVANRTNEITKQLTIFATLFLPLSFIVGFFGQNFEQLSGRGMFIAMVVMLVAFPIGLVLWLRRVGWL